MNKTQFSDFGKDFFEKLEKIFWYFIPDLRPQINPVV